MKSDVTDFAHTHTTAEVTGLNTALAGKADISHSHEIAQVNGLQQALDGKQPTGNYSTAGHTHTKSDVTDFAHSHAISDVTGLQEALDAKATSSELGALAKKNKITLDDIEGDIDLGEYADG